MTIKELRPHEAAKYILDDIVSDPKKLKFLYEIPIKGENLNVGDRLCNKVYGTTTSVVEIEITSSYLYNVFGPLGIKIVIKDQHEDSPGIEMMLISLGKIAKNYYQYKNMNY